MFKIVEKNDHNNLFDEFLKNETEARESLERKQKQYSNIELEIIEQTINYWNANNVNGISQNEADRLAEMGYTMEDAHNMSNEDIQSILK